MTPGLIQHASSLPLAVTSPPCNIANHLPRMARESPGRVAVVRQTCHRRGQASYASITFADLEARSNRCANGFSTIGITPGMRVLVMVRPGFDFLAIVFALFKMGAVVVLIDPGMGIRRLRDCVRHVEPEALVGIPLAVWMGHLIRGSFASLQHVITVGRHLPLAGPTLTQLTRTAGEQFEPAETSPSDPAAILFTSGSTGPAKGVVYEHGMFDAQVRQVQERYGIEAGEIDLPTFPLFALFSTAMGMTAIIPDMNPSRPAQVNPANIVLAIRDQNVTTSFGSPALWKRVARHCVDRKIALPSLRRVLVAGAPVPYPVIEQLHRVLVDGADVHTPYGATESLPVASIAGREVLAECIDLTRTGAGTCVGKPASGIELRIIRIDDKPIAEWSDDLLVRDGDVGEIVVTGPVVTREYFRLPDATASAKIRDGRRLWHRMGDLGRLDGEGRVWFCGRKAHRVMTDRGMMCSVRCEAIFNEHPDVARSALVGIGPLGRRRPVLVVEPEPGRYPRGRRAKELSNELIGLGRANELTSTIDTVLLRRKLPVDIRHNAKISRELLAEWAAEKLR